MMSPEGKGRPGADLTNGVLNAALPLLSSHLTGEVCLLLPTTLRWGSVCVIWAGYGLSYYCGERTRLPHH